MKEQNTQPTATNVEEVVGKSEAFINKYKVQITAAIVAIVVIIGGSVLYNDYVVEPNIKAASEAMFQAQNHFAAQEYDKALNGDEQGNMGFIQIIDEYSGTPSANVANAYAGLSYAQLGQYDKAAATLVKAADKANSQALSPIYLIQAGQIYEKLGKNSEAVKAYQTVKEKYPNNYLSMDIDKYIERASVK